MLELGEISGYTFDDLESYVRANDLTGPDVTDEEVGKFIANLTPKGALKRFLEWNGIIGFTSTILDVVDELRAAEVKDVVPEE